MTNEPNLDPLTLVAFGTVVTEAADKMHPDDASEDYRNGFREAGKLLLLYGMLLQAGARPEEIAEVFKLNIARKNENDVRKLKEMLGDE